MASSVTITEPAVSAPLMAPVRLDMLARDRIAELSASTITLPERVWPMALSVTLLPLVPATTRNSAEVDGLEMSTPFSVMLVVWFST